MLLFITGSFPNFKDGISDGAMKLLYSFIREYNDIVLLTTDLPEIKTFINKNLNIPCYYFENWKITIRNINQFISIIRTNDISIIHMEYPGNGYGKTIFTCVIPLIVRLNNLLSKNKIVINIRLHEFTRARFLRKIVIVPLVVLAHSIYIPSLHDRNTLKKFFAKKIKPTIIGSNIQVSNKLSPNRNNCNSKINIAYFGFVYPGKGIERLLKIWKQIKDNDYENKFTFTIIGEINNKNRFSDYHKSIYNLILKYDLNDSIRITGYLESEEVSRELINTDIAMLLFEDGLTLRRGSFIAYLEHGVPIITVQGDIECSELFSSCKGVFMANNDTEILSIVDEWSKDKKELMNLGKSNAIFSKIFNWDQIGNNLLSEYGLINR